MLSPLKHVVDIQPQVADTPVQVTQTSTLSQQLTGGRNTSPSVFNFGTAAPAETQVREAAPSSFGSHLQEPGKTLTLQHPIDSKKLEPLRNKVIEAIKNRDTVQLEKLRNDSPVVQKAIQTYVDEFEKLQAMVRDQEHTHDVKIDRLMDLKTTLTKRAPTFDETVRRLAVDQALSSASKKQRTE